MATFDFGLFGRGSAVTIHASGKVSLSVSLNHPFNILTLPSTYIYGSFPKFWSLDHLLDVLGQNGENNHNIPIKFHQPIKIHHVCLWTYSPAFVQSCNPFTRSTQYKSHTTRVGQVVLAPALNLHYTEWDTIVCPEDLKHDLTSNKDTIKNLCCHSDLDGNAS